MADKALKLPVGTKLIDQVTGDEVFVIDRKGLEHLVVTGPGGGTEMLNQRKIRKYYKIQK